MKIIIESSALLVQKKTGVEHYIYRLFSALFEIDDSNTYALAYLAFFTKPQPDLKLDYPNVSHRRISWLPGKVYNLLLRTPFAPPFDILSRTKADIFVFPNYARWPLWRTKKSLLFVHDTAYLDFPEVLKTRHHQLFLSWIVPRSIKKSTHVVVISESTKQSLIKHYGTPAAKISVVTPAVDHTVFKPAGTKDIERTKKKYGVSKKYLLYLGTLEPRKNIRGIVRAYQSLPDELKRDYQLVLGGGSGWLTPDMENEINKIPKGQLIRTGYLDGADMAPLYSGAELFVYPSIFEGWGMQVLEAMACGTPVLTADNSSLPEAGGKAAAYAKTGDQADLNKKLQELLANPAKLAEMKKLGLAHAESFDWKSSAAKLLDVLKTIA